MAAPGSDLDAATLYWKCARRCTRFETHGEIQRCQRMCRAAILDRWLPTIERVAGASRVYCLDDFSRIDRSRPRSSAMIRR
jgi:hypothetical protein